MKTMQLLLLTEQTESKATAVRATSKSGATNYPSKANTQCARILAVLERAAKSGEGWVSLPAILSLYIANYRMRITELRRAGHNIELKDERVDGQRHTAYRLKI